MAPLGYDTKDRKITVNDTDADRFRNIFRSYLKLGTLNLLMVDLRNRGIVTKVRTLKTGQTVGGIPFTRGRSLISFATGFTSETWSSRGRPWQASSLPSSTRIYSMRSKPS
jgi:hypothetical protein